MDEGQTGDEVKFPRFSREAAMGLGNFSVDTAAVARYLEAVERELRSMFPLVLRLTMEAETPRGESPQSLHAAGDRLGAAFSI
jgi:hypothetical protein